MCLIISALLQSQIVSNPLNLNGALASLLLGGVQVFGVPSQPLYVLVNGEKVIDFTYKTDTKVSSGSDSAFCFDAFQLQQK